MSAAESYKPWVVPLLLCATAILALIVSQCIKLLLPGAFNLIRSRDSEDPFRKLFRKAKHLAKVDQRPTYGAFRAAIGTVVASTVALWSMSSPHAKAVFGAESVSVGVLAILACATAVTTFYILDLLRISREGRILYGALGALLVFTIWRVNVQPVSAVLVMASATMLAGVYNSNRLKRLESKLGFVEKQLEELYGPAIAVLEQQQVHYGELLNWIGLSDDVRQKSAPNQWLAFADEKVTIVMLCPFQAFRTTTESSSEYKFIALYESYLQTSNARVVSLFASNTHLVAPNLTDVPPSISVFMHHAAQLQFRAEQYRRGWSHPDDVAGLSDYALVRFPSTLLLELAVKFVLLQALQNKYRTQVEFAKILDVVSSQSRIPTTANEATPTNFEKVLLHICTGADSGYVLRRKIVEEAESAADRQLGVIKEAADSAQWSRTGLEKYVVLARVTVVADWLKQFDRFVRLKAHPPKDQSPLSVTYINFHGVILPS
jgi:hypothetical protein